LQGLDNRSQAIALHRGSDPGCQMG
jgi:hypothetical protein